MQGYKRQVVLRSLRISISRERAEQMANVGAVSGWQCNDEIFVALTVISVSVCRGRQQYLEECLQ